MRATEGVAVVVVVVVVEAVAAGVRVLDAPGVRVELLVAAGDDLGVAVGVPTCP